MNNTETSLMTQSALNEKRLKQIKVRKALEPEELRKYHGIAEDATAKNYFKNSKQVLDLM